MSYWDWIVLIGTIGFIVIYGSWKNRSHKNIKEYLRGDNKATWWTVGLSVMATQASAITFLSTPGQAFHDGMGFIQFYFGLPLAMVVICLFFIPVYHKLKVYTAYEFLEQRFDLKTRTLTALLFLIQRGLAAGITIYAPSIILSVVLGWPLKTLIIIIGLVVVGYTLIGGTNAVNVTQKQQMFVIFLGLFLTFYYVVQGFPDAINFEKALQIASVSDKLKVLDFELSFNNRYNLWSGLTGGFFLALSYFGTDQSQVQRYLTGKSIRESQLGLIMNGFLKIPMQFLILLLGVMVFVFYQFQIAPLHFNQKAQEAILNSAGATEYRALETANKNTQLELKELLLSPDFFDNHVKYEHYKTLEYLEETQRAQAKELLNTYTQDIETNDKDYVLISYILSHLPQGLIGLLLAVILSAAMSSSASEINALAATTTVDLYRRHRGQYQAAHYVKASKFFTLFWGLIAILFASISNLFENLIQLINIIGSVFYGTILGVFLVAFFLKQIGGKAVFWAALCTEIVVLLIFSLDLVSFLWLNVIGALCTVLLSMLLNRLIKP
ncbi:MAG: sodium:solute symporter [Flavobacteriaceae bacterium]|jgi:Na+/proline symporter